MSSFYGIPDDEFGSGGNIVGFRRMEDISDEKDTYWLMKDGITSAVRRAAISQTKPLVMRAGQNIQFFGTNLGWQFNNNSGEAMIKSFSLKKGTITGFSDNAPNALATTTVDHNLNVGDKIWIIDSRVGDYTGLQTVTATPSATTFEIDVPFNGVDGQCDFIQDGVFISGSAKSTQSEEITEDPTIVNGGTLYTDAETATVTGQTSGAINATVTLSVIDGIVQSATLVLAGSDYTDGETVTLTGLTSLSNDATAIITVGPELTTLTMINHPLDDDISIILDFGGPMIPPGGFIPLIVRNVTTDTVDVERTFTVSQTPLANVGIKGAFFMDEQMAVFPPFRVSPLFDISGSSLPGPGGIGLTNTLLLDFQGSSIRGLEGGFEISLNSRVINCNGFEFIDCDFVNANDMLTARRGNTARTEDFASCFRILPSISGLSQLSFSQNNLTEYRVFQSMIDIPEIVESDATYNIFSNSDAAPATIFSLGFVAVSENSAIIDAGGGQITIPVDQTIRYREGDEIEIVDSTSYNGEIGTIQAAGIILDTSITVDIAFVAGDTQVTLIDNTLISKDQTDPQVTGSQNNNLLNSTVSGNATLPFNAAEIVSIVTDNVPVAIGGTWESSQLERIDFNTSGGIFTYIGLAPRKVIVSISATVTGSASQIFALHLLQNGIDITDAPPIIDIINANTGATAGVAQIITISPGDTFQQAISNLVNTQDPTVAQAHMTITALA